MSMDRMRLLEQQVTVLQQEINAVLGEIQGAMQSLTRANQMAFTVMDKRLTALEENTIVTEQPEEHISI